MTRIWEASVRSLDYPPFLSVLQWNHCGVSCLWYQRCGLPGHNNNRAMAKNGSSRCFLAKNGCTLKTIAAESVVGHIWLANTHYLPFLAKSDRVLPVIATLLSFHPFLAIFCSVFGHFMFISGGLLDYSNRSTSATRTNNSKISPQVTRRLTIFSHFSVNNFEVTSYTPVCLGDTLEALLHQPEPQQEPLQKIGRCIDCRRSRQWPGSKASLRSFVMTIRRWTVPQKMPRHDTIDPMLLPSGPSCLRNLSSHRDAQKVYMCSVFFF